MTTKRVPNPLQERAANFVQANEWLLKGLLRGELLGVSMPIHKLQPIVWGNTDDLPIPDSVPEETFRFSFERSFIRVVTSDICCDRKFHTVFYKQAPAIRDPFGNVYAGKYQASSYIKPCFCYMLEPTEETAITSTST